MNKKCLGKGLGALIKTDAQRVDLSKEYEDGNISKIDFKRLEFYKSALKQALADGMISPDERMMLKSMRDYLKITDEEHSMVEGEVLAEMDPAILEAAAKRKEDAKDVAVEHGIMEEGQKSEPAPLVENEPVEIRAKTDATEEEVEEVELVEVDHTKGAASGPEGTRKAEDAKGEDVKGGPSDAKQTEDSVTKTTEPADDADEFEEVAEEEEVEKPAEASKPKPPPPPSDDRPNKAARAPVIEWSEGPKAAKQRTDTKRSSDIEWD